LHAVGLQTFRLHLQDRRVSEHNSKQSIGSKKLSGVLNYSSVLKKTGCRVFSAAEHPRALISVFPILLWMQNFDLNKWKGFYASDKGRANKETILGPGQQRWNNSLNMDCLGMRRAVEEGLQKAILQVRSWK
jgi:hypothetical protein